MLPYISLAVVIAAALIMEFVIEPRFLLRQRLLRLTVMRRRPDKRVWWPGAFIYALALIASMAALDALLAAIRPEFGDDAFLRYLLIAVIVLLFLPRKHDWTERDESDADEDAA